MTNAITRLTRRSEPHVGLSARKINVIAHVAAFTSAALLVGFSLLGPAVAHATSPAASKPAPVIELDGTVELGAFGGYLFLSDDNELGNAFYDDNVPTSGPLLGVRAGYNFNRVIALEGELKVGSSSFRRSGDPATLFGARGLILIHFYNMMGGRLRSFVSLGYGLEILGTKQVFPAWTWRPEDSAEVDADAAAQGGLGVKYLFGDHLLARLDLRYINAAGRLALTSDSFEVLLGVSYFVDTQTRDADGDGIIDSFDKCPKRPEDKDGFEDKDGCPDLDNDGDGVPDASDQCVNKAEDKDNYRDEDGCPDEDNDKDGIPDTKDKCPDKAEDKDGFQDGDGCPDEDNDHDRIKDVDDRCPNAAGPASEHGCPIQDADKDGIPDKIDKCPKKAETFNGYKDDDGCPDKKSTVVITKDEIKILQKVYFEVGKADIMSKSHGLLNTLALVLSKQPAITRIRIEGHTDDMGTDASNLKLSQARAAAVRSYLISKGVRAERLSAKGYGESQPVCKDALALIKGGKKKQKQLDRCREQNRRVQFKISEVNGKPVAATDTVTIETKKVVPAD